MSIRSPVKRTMSIRDCPVLFRTSRLTVFLSASASFTWYIPTSPIFLARRPFVQFISGALCSQDRLVLETWNRMGGGWITIPLSSSGCARSAPPFRSLSSTSLYTLRSTSLEGPRDLRDLRQPGNLCPLYLNWLPINQSLSHKGELLEARRKRTLGRF